MAIQPKPLAALTATLLARKGSARPAMRPQGFGGFNVPLGSGEDLGWNDMGDAPEVHAEPVVLRQRQKLHDEIEAPVPELKAPEPEPVLETDPVAAQPGPAVVEPVPEIVDPEAESAAIAATVADTPKTKARAAFTLRLDHDRHLQLRLASTLRKQSAQRLVTAALDAYLQSQPDVTALVRQLSSTDAQTRKPS